MATQHLNRGLRAWIIWERVETLKALLAAAGACGVDVRGHAPLSDQPQLGEYDLLFLEQCEPSSALIARTQAFAALDERSMLAVVVPAGIEPGLETSVLEAGAFCVLELDHHVERQLRRVARTARRVVQVEVERTRLGADLAHREQLSAIGVLAAGVGHEINNPSSVVLVAAEQIREELETLLSVPRYQQTEYLQRYIPRWLEDLGDCIAATRRIATVVKTLGVFSRRRNHAAPVEVDLNEEVSTVIRLIGKEMRYQASVDLDLDPDLPAVAAGPHVLTQVVTNLVVNALQALEEADCPERTLHIRTRYDDTSVLLEVVDNGPGIPEDVIDRIFDPFFTTREAGTGTGLGLAITQELVHKAGGELFVESVPGHGARFWVVLPHTGAASSADKPPSAPPRRESRLRVMIVDDDEFVLRTLARSLSADFECVPVASAQEAMTALYADPKVDALLADIVMPGMNGYELYEAVKEAYPQLAERTVFLSGGIRNPKLQDAIQSSGRLCLDKPIDVRALGRTLRDVARGD